MLSRHNAKIISLSAALLLFAAKSSFAELLDLESMAKKQEFSVIAQDDFSPPPLEEFERPRAIVLPNNSFALVSVRCERKDCVPFAALLKGTPGDFQVVKSIDLPRPHKPEIFEVKPPIITDFIGNGEQELLARYVLNLPPRPGSGSLYYEYLAVLRLSDLSQLAFFEIERCGQGAVDRCCLVKIEQADFDHDGFKDLKTITSCSDKRCIGPKADASCPPSESQTPHLLYWHNDSKKYAEIKNEPVHIPPPVPVDIANAVLPDGSSGPVTPLPPPPIPWWFTWLSMVLAALLIILGMGLWFILRRKN